jgi:hypothetical protein
LFIYSSLVFPPFASQGVRFKQEYPEQAYHEVMSAQEDDADLISTVRRRPKPIIRANTIRRKELLSQMGDSAAVRKSEDKTLQLNDWTKAANKSLVRAQNRTHSFSALFCPSGALSFDWLEHLIYAVIALAVQIVFGHAWAFPD